MGGMIKKYFIYHDYLSPEEQNQYNDYGMSAEEIDLIIKEDGLYHPFSDVKVEYGWYFNSYKECMDEISKRILLKN